MMKCEDVRKDIHALGLSILDGRREGELREHLGACHFCQQYLSETEKVSELVRQYVKGESSLIPENVISARVDAAIEDMGSLPGQRFRWALKYLLPPLAATVALLAILFYSSGVKRETLSQRKFSATVESIEAKNATVMLVDKGMDTPKVIWIIEREDI